MRYLKILLLVCVLAVFHDVADAQVYLERMLTGVVLDENGEPMPGVVVASADGKRGVMTDGISPVFCIPMTPPTTASVCA